MEQKQKNEKWQKFEDGVIPIGRQPAEFYMGVVYREIIRRKGLKLISRGDIGISKVLLILTELLSGKVIELPNNEVSVKFNKAVNDRNQEVMLPSVEVTITKIQNVGGQNGK